MGTAKMKAIHISKAIDIRRDEINRIEAIIPKVYRLIAEAQASEKGVSTMSDQEWESLRFEVEEELDALGVDHPTAGGRTGDFSPVPSGQHWSSGQLFF